MRGRRLGRKVQKTFQDLGRFAGSVVKYRPKKKLWSIEFQFHGGEVLEEDLAREQLEEILLPEEASGEGGGAQSSDGSGDDGGDGGGGDERTEGGDGAECSDGGDSDDAERDYSDGGNE